MLGVASLLSSFVSCIIARCILSLFISSASSSFFVAIPSQFHCIILNPNLLSIFFIDVLSSEVGSTQGGLSSLHIPHSQVPCLLCSTSASLVVWAYLMWYCFLQLLQISGSRVRLILAVQLLHFSFLGGGSSCGRAGGSSTRGGDCGGQTRAGGGAHWWHFFPSAEVGMLAPAPKTH